DRSLEGVGHRKLLRPMLIARQPGCNTPLRAQDGSWRNHGREKSKDRRTEEPNVAGTIDYSGFPCPPLLARRFFGSSEFANANRVPLQPMRPAPAGTRNRCRQERPLSEVSGSDDRARDR